MPSKCINLGASIPRRGYRGLDGNAGCHLAMHDFAICTGKSPTSICLGTQLRPKPATPRRGPMRTHHQQCMYGAIRTSAVDGSLHGPVSTGLMQCLQANQPGPAHNRHASIALHFAIQAFKPQQSTSPGMQHLSHIHCSIRSHIRIDIRRNIDGLVCRVTALAHLDRTMR